jgi:hypothetical protein
MEVYIALYPYLYKYNKDFASLSQCVTQNVPKIHCNGLNDLMLQWQRAPIGMDAPVVTTSFAMGSAEVPTMHYNGWMVGGGMMVVAASRRHQFVTAPRVEVQAEAPTLL